MWSHHPVIPQLLNCAAKPVQVTLGDPVGNKSTQILGEATRKKVVSRVRPFWWRTLCIEKVPSHYHFATSPAKGSSLKRAGILSSSASPSKFFPSIAVMVQPAVRCGCPGFSSTKSTCMPQQVGVSSTPAPKSGSTKRYGFSGSDFPFPPFPLPFSPFSPLPFLRVLESKGS